MRLRAIYWAAGLAAAIGGVTVVGAADNPIDWTRAKDHWSFRTPVAQKLPAVKLKAWPKRGMDTFILARLEKAGLKPSPEADPRTLIRRVTYDLTGLPPTPEEVEAYVRESKSPGAYERLVDRLLASPSFGERMAAMWLPLARYAEDQAHQVGSDTKYFYPNSHFYREWVISAFNKDLPYDRFIRLQIAGDRYPDTSKEDLAGLGFLGLGPKYYDRERLDVLADEWQDRVDTVTRTFLGLTVACARCHDHKYDPITQEDYYALAGVFASTKMVNKTPEGVVQKGDLEAAKMDKSTIHVVEDENPHDINVFLRGNPQNKGPVAHRRFLKVLSAGEPEPFKEGSGRKELAEDIASAQNPLTARVLVNRVWALCFGKPLVGTPSNFGLIGDKPTHPELLDYLANRFAETPKTKDQTPKWRDSAGEGLGWSVKSLIRELVTSATYRQSSAERQSAPMLDPRLAQRNTNRRVFGQASVAQEPYAVDPSNSLDWRMNRRRTTVEQWRDSVLFVSGQLDRSGGPAMDLSDPNNKKRTVCAKVSRLKLNDLLVQFDYPDANVHAEKRAVTTTPMQKLFLLNGDFMQAQAKVLSDRLAAEVTTGDAERIKAAYHRLYGRAPHADELKLGLEYLQKPENDGMPRWERYVQALLISNEMFYVD